MINDGENEFISRPPPAFLVSECGKFHLYKQGRGIATRYVCLEFDSHGLLIGQMSADRLAPFYNPTARWNFPFTAKPEPDDFILPDGWELKAEGPARCSRVVTFSSARFADDPAFASGTLALVQLWDGEEWVNYIEGDYLSLCRLIGFYAPAWLADLGDAGGISPDEFPFPQYQDGDYDA